MINTDQKLNRTNSILIRNNKEAKTIAVILQKYTKEKCRVRNYEWYCDLNNDSPVYTRHDTTRTSYIFFDDEYDGWTIGYEPKINTTVIDLNSISREINDILLIILLDKIEESI
jgi:hypothetical protein